MIASAEVARTESGTSALALTRRLLQSDTADNLSSEETKARKAVAVVCERLSMLAQALQARIGAGALANGGGGIPRGSGKSRRGSSSSPRGTTGGQEKEASELVPWSRSWTGTALEVSVEKSYSAPVTDPDGANAQTAAALAFKRSWINGLMRPAMEEGPMAKKRHLIALRRDLKTAVAAA